MSNNQSNNESASDVAVLTFDMMKRCIVSIRSRCDGASSEDGVGFSQNDAAFGFAMATAAQEGRRFSLKMITGVQKLCIKYRRQLATYIADFDIDAIKNLDISAVEKAQLQIFKKESHVYVLATAHTETEKAVFLKQVFRGHAVSGWIPKSQMQKATAVVLGMEKEYLLPEWIVKKYGFRLAIQPVKQVEIA